ncbi:hypothetical protein FRX31_026917 [Thalictrum thalictroides]|uniref:Uncharacterized protein n=1 Tax=Thalictrum thalictroides TaxID=46969 RepID=A0A7J6VFH7_THATH|nr:hypothetical protein FRX31_026917 [Thalictrum thalictroides]
MVWGSLIGHIERAKPVLLPAELKVNLVTWPCLNSRGLREDIWRLLPCAVFGSFGLSAMR